MHSTNQTSGAPSSEQWQIMQTNQGCDDDGNQKTFPSFCNKMELYQYYIGNKQAVRGNPACKLGLV